MSIRASDWGRRFKQASLPLLLAGLAACATPFNADVTRFETQLPAPEGQSFAIVAEDPALAGGLEFSHYASQVAAQMQRLGYAQALTPEDATLLVHFDYGIDRGRERIRRSGFYDPWYGYGGFGYGGWGGYGYGRYRGFYGGGPWAYGFYDPFFGGYDSYTVYTSGIDLKIDRAADKARLFEGKAQALSTSNRLQYLIPNLVDAMFTDFPGESGRTVRISVAPEKTASR
jgi:hypothetical protein